MREQFLVFGAPQIDEVDVAAAAAVVRSGWLGTGPRVAEFEGLFAEYKHVPSAAAVNSCTAALHLSLLAAGIGAGDEVITTAMTFAATINVIIHVGATPVLADCNRDTLNIDPAEVQRKVTSRTKAILPVHFAGRAADMGALLEIAARHNLSVIEDCAHAVETIYDGHGAGTLGDFGCFSFYATKNVITGEGGMVISKHEELLSRIRTLSLHGLSRDAWKRFGKEGYHHYQVTEAGFKYNMMDLQAAIGIEQLRRVESNWKRRAEIWARYQEAFSDVPVFRPPAVAPHTRHAYHLYTIQIDEGAAGISRDQFLNEMTKRNIGVGVHYLSIPEHPYYRDRYGWSVYDYPRAAAIGQQTVSLPLSAKLTDNDLEDVVESVYSALNCRN